MYIYVFAGHILNKYGDRGVLTPHTTPPQPARLRETWLHLLGALLSHSFSIKMLAKYFASAADT